MAKKNKKTEIPEEALRTAETAEETIAVSEEAVAESIDATVEETNDSEPKTGTVSRPVNFRTGPSFNKAVITELKAGTKITINGSEAGDKGKWYKCGFDGRTGFVKATGIIVDK